MKRIAFLIIVFLCTFAQGAGADNTTSVFQPVDPSNYPDNMSMVVSLVRGGEALTTAELGVFIGGECRAAATSKGGLYYLLISGQGSGQPMEIRAAINGNIQVVSNNLTYTSDGNIGTPWAPYVIRIIDLNLDGKTDISDMIILVNAIMAGSKDLKYDINNDHNVDVADIAALVEVMALN